MDIRSLIATLVQPPQRAAPTASARPVVDAPKVARPEGGVTVTLSPGAKALAARMAESLPGTVDPPKPPVLAARPTIDRRA